jgi:SET domain-containing protein
MEAFKSILEIKPTTNGNGVFAKVPIEKNSVVFEFKGKILTKSQLPQNLKPEDDHYLQIGPDMYLGPSGDLDDFVNHSCEPNCGLRIVGQRAILFALYDIKSGAELTFDYSTTSTETQEAWSMACNCGSYQCRKTISGFQYLTPLQQAKYMALNAVPTYVTKS